MNKRKKLQRRFSKWKQALLRQRYTRVKARYKITHDDFMDLMQSTECDLCKTPFADLSAIQIDHCHTTGVVRGALCFRCNAGLGMFKDNLETMKRAVSYIECWSDVKTDPERLTVVLQNQRGA
jgi:hypothetical protein